VLQILYLNLFECQECDFFSDRDTPFARADLYLRRRLMLPHVAFTMILSFVLPGMDSGS
jgi:hypothetical protein